MYWQLLYFLLVAKKVKYCKMYSTLDQHRFSNTKILNIILRFIFNLNYKVALYLSKIGEILGLIFVDWVYFILFIRSKQSNHHYDAILDSSSCPATNLILKFYTHLVMISLKRNHFQLLNQIFWKWKYHLFYLKIH
jgi:hypothetical protein